MRVHSVLFGALLAVGCLTIPIGAAAQKQLDSENGSTRVVGPAKQVVLPKPSTQAVPPKPRKIIGWPAGGAPTAPPGFRVTALAEDIVRVRTVYALPNGDVLVAEANRPAPQEGQPPSPPSNRILLLRDRDGDGRAEVQETFLSGLNLPFGMLLIGNNFYVGNTDALLRFPYQSGQTQITAPGEKLLDLPSGGVHVTRSLLASADGSKIYIGVGSATDADADDTDSLPPDRAAIWEVNPDGSGKRVFANGIRNPTGMGWAPGTKTLWIVVNERGGLGDDTPPDYLTSVRQEGFYGWPYYFWGKFEEPRVKKKRPELLGRTLTPDYALGSHVAPLGMVFYTAASFPREYQGVAFVGFHGSSGRSSMVGYKVVSIPFKNGKPNGEPKDFLTGFLANPDTGEVYGRPVGLAVTKDGSLVVADDTGNKVWQVTHLGAQGGSR